MNFDNFIQTILNLNPWLFAKILVCFGLFVYLFFALLVVRQVDLMGKTLNGALNLPLKLIAWLHLFIAIAIFLLSLIIL